jgi:hypothetical protein
VKQEILFQANLIDEEIISKLFPARKARNKLVHEGKSVPEEVALDLYKVVQLLIAKSANTVESLSFKINPDTWESKMDKSNFDESYFEDWKELKNNYT